MVIALAEQLGSFLGRVQKKADGWLENEALATQVSQIRDGADPVVEAGESRRRGGAEGGREVDANATKRQRPRKPTTRAAKGRSGGAVDAPGKRHRKPPPQELFDPRLGEPMGKQMGQKSLSGSVADEGKGAMRK